jgi:hypothetical protein
VVLRGPIFHGERLETYLLTLQTNLVNGFSRLSNDQMEESDAALVQRFLPQIFKQEVTIDFDTPFRDEPSPTLDSRGSRGAKFSFFLPVSGDVDLLEYRPSAGPMNGFPSVVLDHGEDAKSYLKFAYPGPANEADAAFKRDRETIRNGFLSIVGTLKMYKPRIEDAVLQGLSRRRAAIAQMTAESDSLSHYPLRPR